MKKLSSKKKQENLGLTPVGDRALILPLSDEELGTTSPAGIIIPETVNREKADRGTVIAVGDGKYNENGELVPMRVKKGDRVIFQWGDKVDFGNEEYYLVSESNILAIIN